jgi:cytochrome b involved in lipid metabolism
MLWIFSFLNIIKYYYFYNYFIMTEKVFTYDDVFKHNKPEDNWLIINGGVYDITGYTN